MCDRAPAGPLAAMAQKAPDALVRSVADDVLKIVQQDRRCARRQREDGRLIEEKIVPHFDFERMTKLAVAAAGARHARPAPDADQQFRTLLVRSYSAATAPTGRS